MTAILQWLQPKLGEGWIHASLNAPAQSRAALLIVPPFFHEWQRGYRLFALLADALASEGIAVMRFDYRGCGDSSGEDSEFLPSRAMADTETAMQALIAATGHSPTLLGVRGGGLIADAVAGPARLPFAFWQPVHDGAGHIAELRRMDRSERNSRMRFPYLRGTRADDIACLMGHRIHPEFETELAVFRNTGRPRFVVDPGPPQSAAHGLLIGNELAEWAQQLDMGRPVPRRQVDAVAQAIAEHLCA